LEGTAGKHGNKFGRVEPERAIREMEEQEKRHGKGEGAVKHGRERDREMGKKWENGLVKVSDDSNPNSNRPVFHPRPVAVRGQTAPYVRHRAGFGVNEPSAMHQ